MPADEFLVELGGFVRKYARNDLDSGVSQSFETTPGHKRIRVFDRADDTFDSGVYQCIGARRCFALV